MGDNGEVASSMLLAENQVGYLPDGQSRILILDLQTNTAVFEAEGGMWGRDEFDSHIVRLTWIDNERFLIQGVNETLDQIVQLGDDTVEVLATFEDSSTILSPDRQFVMVYNNDNPLSLYDTVNQQLTSVVQSHAADDYQISAQWYDSDKLLLTIRDDNGILAQWIVNITQSI